MSILDNFDENPLGCNQDSKLREELSKKGLFKRILPYLWGLFFIFFIIFCINHDIEDTKRMYPGRWIEVRDKVGDIGLIITEQVKLEYLRQFIRDVAPSQSKIGARTCDLIVSGFSSHRDEVFVLLSSFVDWEK